eukprot:6542057-Alexandrium_andersonii.AAC.1
MCIRDRRFPFPGAGEGDGHHPGLRHSHEAAEGREHHLDGHRREAGQAHPRLGGGAEAREGRGEVRD